MTDDVSCSQAFAVTVLDAASVFVSVSRGEQFIGMSSVELTG